MADHGRVTGPSRPGRGVVEAPAVARGALVAVAVCLPLALLSRAATDGDDGSPLAAALFLATLVGFAAGGWAAGRAARSAPYTNGGVAALVAFAAIQGTALVVRVLAGDPPSLPAILFSGLLAYGAGLAGGAVAARARPEAAA